MVGSNVPLEHFKALTAAQADDVIGKYRLLGRNYRFGRKRLDDWLGDGEKGSVDAFDQCRQLAGCHVVSDNVRRDDLGR
jgi:hypothetical protein